MVLAHTVLALEGGRPARVECNTCHGQHNYRPGTAEARPAPSSSPRASTTTSSRTRISFDEILNQKQGTMRTYSPKGTFVMDEVVSHPTFGRGFVSGVRPDKVEVTFRVGTKTLIHGRT